MNILFCIGRNYRDFSPLNHSAQRFAKEHFGAIHQMSFWDSLSSSNRNYEMLLESLKFSIQQASNLLILASYQDFDDLLEVMKNNMGVESRAKNLVSQSRIELTHQTQNKICKIALVDLQRVFADKMESQMHLKPCADSKISVESPMRAESYVTPLQGVAQNQMFLYLLGLDGSSAQALLGGIARDFEVDLEVLNADSNLEILTASSEDYSALCEFAKVVQATFVDKVFASFNLAQSVIEMLTQKGLKITTAESCTGGLIAYYLTKESGASAVFDGGVISYANAIKEAWLEVGSEDLEDFGAVSEVVVRGMLEGALKLSGADFALATSGIAGPSGGSATKPVGMVFVGAKSRKGAEIIECLHFKGDRNFIQEQATLYAYLLFLRIFLIDY
ncbi:CinA family protein [Helicobacter sp. MIT 05-5294]|uniref:CinA family protein n=1 Tax=Helicobacter sp. MIT 05-5294 TaxID=1548150 RepID=UPI00051FCB0E|nr:CinA family protein [Helicobacter sp. MIT 05-5294]TLD89115.1 CinA family protein [Helicobacter sp. MIT 05-5294]